MIGDPDLSVGSPNDLADVAALERSITEWLRRPDHADVFSLHDLVNWVNDRPFATFGYLCAALSAARAEVERLRTVAFKAEALKLLAESGREVAEAERDRMAEALREIELAEREYRRQHDLRGPGQIETGRAWDRLRRAGDKARAALNAEKRDGGAS